MRTECVTGMAARAVAVLCAALVFVWLSAGPARAAGSFGVSSFGLSVSSTQAAGHPDFTTSFAFNTDSEGAPIGQVKDIHVNLPVGLVGDPQAVPRCSPAELSQYACAPATQVGVLETRFVIPGQEPFEERTPVYSVTPSEGHVAEFASSLAIATIMIDVDLRRDGSYGLSATINDVSTLLPLQSSSFTLWGIPADPSHDAQRIGPAPEYQSPIAAGVSPAPFMIQSSDCESGPLAGSLSVDSWQEPGVFKTSTATAPAPTGCRLLAPSPSLSVAADTTQAGSPSGYEVDLGVPQVLAPYAFSTPDLRDVSLTLPAGTVVNPSAANGLGACSEAQIALGSGNPVSCPDSSRVGTVEILTPLLGEPLVGSVYLAAQEANPFKSLLALYLVAEGGGAQIKLAGEVAPSLETGQLTATFKGNPQVQFNLLRLHLFGGPGAPLSNPTACGQATSTSRLSFYSGQLAEPASAFTVTGCTPGQFNPSFQAGTLNNQAGGFGALSATFSRTDQDQGLAGVKVTTPPGLLGLLKTVPLCAEPQAAAGSCGQESLIGHTTILAGSGPDPVAVTGQVFLTGPYKGAPFGLSIVVPAIAGPFNLGTVLVRATINVDPHTAALTVASDPFPAILKGIPLQIQTVNVTIDRPGFIFSPSDCEPLSVGGTITSTQGTQAQVTGHFQAANCAALAFKPSFKVSTSSQTSKQNGASLNVKLSFPHPGPRSGGQSGEANIAKVHVELPKSLPARLTTLQKACTEAEFNANPATCPSASVVGHAKAITPILPVPLEGPAYFVSHGGAKFPELILVLQGYGVTIDLAGETFINSRTGVTSSTFANVPDAPVSSFELKLPEGEFSALGANGHPCAQKLEMPTKFVAQNGAVLTQSTHIEVEGCSNTLSVESKSLKGHTLTLKISVPAAGKLKASGKNLSSASKSSGGRETVVVKLHVKRHGKTKVRLSFVPKKGKHLAKTVSVKA